MFSRRVLSLLSAGFLVLVLAGCTALLGPTSTESTPTAGATSAQASSQPKASPHAILEKLVIREVLRTDVYRSFASSAINSESPAVKWLTDSAIAVAFDVRPAATEAAEDADFVIYPALVFVMDSQTRTPIDVLRLTVDLDEGLQTCESLIDGRTSSQALPQCAADRLLQARQAAQDRRTEGWRATPKYECDESIAYPKTVCWCTEEVPGGFDPECVDTCVGVCGLLPPPWNTICGAACFLCYVNGYCVAWDCHTIYPCGW